jgi:hypothetical protein
LRDQAASRAKSLRPGDNPTRLEARMGLTSPPSSRADPEPRHVVDR